MQQVALGMMKQERKDVGHPSKGKKWSRSKHTSWYWQGKNNCLRKCSEYTSFWSPLLCLLPCTLSAQLYPILVPSSLLPHLLLPHPPLPFSYSWPIVFSNLSDSLSSHLSAKHSEEYWDKWGSKATKIRPAIGAESFPLLQEDLLIPEYHCPSSSPGHFPHSLKRGCTLSLLSQGPAWVSSFSKKSRQDGHPVPASSFS